MKFERHKINNWVLPGVSFNSGYSAATNKRILFSGRSNWRNALSNYCRTVEVDFCASAPVNAALLSASDAIFLAPTIRIREDGLARSFGKSRDAVLSFVRSARDLGKPIYGICEDLNAFSVFAEIFDGCDKVIFVGDRIPVEFDQQRAECWPALFCSRTFNPFFTFAQNQALEKHATAPILAQGSHLFNVSPKARELFGVLGKSLTVFDYDFSSRSYRVNQGIHKNEYLGTVDSNSYLGLIKKAKAQIFVDDSAVDRAVLIKRLIENNACYSASLVLSDTPEVYERFGALAFSDPFELLDALSLIQSLPEYGERITHLGWRKAHANYSLYKLLRCLNVIEKDIKASVITPSVRPENRARILENYRSQVYENKELIVVANGGDKTEWCAVSDELNGITNMSVLNLSTDILAAGALNAGILKSDGDLCFRLDDDDIYGAHYLSDVVLHFIATDSDIMGKKMEYVFFPHEKELYRRTFPNHPSFLYGQWPEKFHTIAGNSFALKREFIASNGFMVGTSGFADSEFLLYCSEIRPVPNIAFLDSRSLVIVREDAGKHTWQAGKEFFTLNASSVGCSYEYLLE